MTTKPRLHQLVTDYLWELLPGQPVGSELPTILDMQQRFDIHGVQTVRDGVQPLVDAGYVTTRYAGQRRWVITNPVPAGAATSPVEPPSAAVGRALTTAENNDVLTQVAVVDREFAQLKLLLGAASN